MQCFNKLFKDLISLFLSLFKKLLDAKKLNYKTQDNNQFKYKSKSCRAAEEFCKFSMERKAGLASITRGCHGGSLTGVFGSENPSSSSMVIGLATDPSSQGKRKPSNG